MQPTSLPEAYRFCPRCGQRNPAPGSVPFKCPSCGFASFFGPVAAVGGLIVDHARLLLVRRARDPGLGKWGLPGGFVDAGETVTEALAREVLEETQLEVTNWDYLTSFPNQYIYQGIAAPVIDFFFVCQVRDTSSLSLAPDELDQHVWVSDVDEYIDHMAFTSNRAALELWSARSDRN